MRDSQIFLQNFLGQDFCLNEPQMRPLSTERQLPLPPSFGGGLGRRLCGDDNLVGIRFPLIRTFPVAHDRVSTHTDHLHVIADPKAAPLAASPIFKSPILHFKTPPAGVGEGAVASCGKTATALFFNLGRLGYLGRYKWLRKTSIWRLAVGRRLKCWEFTSRFHAGWSRKVC